MNAVASKVFGTIYRGVAEPEGPVSLGASEWLIAEMGTGAITRFGQETNDREVIAITGRPNGLAIDGNGGIWVAESKRRCLMRLDPGNPEPEHVTSVASGEALLWPNDLCFGPDGTLYLTDSGTNLSSDGESGSDPSETAWLDGRIIAFDPREGKGHIVDRGIKFANGIAVGPDEMLYVAETFTGLIHRYPLSDVRAETRETFADVMEKPSRNYSGVAGPDGMAFDEEGNLHVAVLTQGTLTSLSLDGSVIDHHPLPDSYPTNAAFGGPNSRQLLVTGAAQGILLLAEMPIPGLPLHRPSLR